VPGGVVRAALGQGLGLPGLRAWGLCRAQGSRGLAVQPLQAPSRLDRGHRVPLDQAAADHLVSGDLPSEPEQGRDELDRAGAPARHPPADRLADQAQADGGDAGARGREAQAWGAGRDRPPRSRFAGRRAGCYLGGGRSGGKRGRGAAGKTPFVAAVETTAERKPRRLKLTVVKGFRKKEIERLAKRDRAGGSNVVTDGLSCWTAVSEAGCNHFPMVTGSGPRAARWVRIPTKPARDSDLKPAGDSDLKAATIPI
jgi:ISXO2-like transposase domain